MEKILKITEQFEHPISNKVEDISLVHSIPKFDEKYDKVFDEYKLSSFKLIADSVNKEFVEYKNKLYYSEIYDYAKLKIRVLFADNNPGICYYISSKIINNIIEIKNPVIIGNQFMINLLSNLWTFGKENSEEHQRMKGFYIHSYNDILLYPHRDEYNEDVTDKIEMIIYHGDNVKSSDREIVVFNKENPKQSLVLKFNLTDENYDYIWRYSNR